MLQRQHHVDRTRHREGKHQEAVRIDTVADRTVHELADRIRHKIDLACHTEILRADRQSGRQLIQRR